MPYLPLLSVPYAREKRRIILHGIVRRSWSTSPMTPPDGSVMEDPSADCRCRFHASERLHARLRNADTTRSQKNINLLKKSA